MKLKIGNTTLNVTEAYPYRYGNGKLVLKFTTPKTEIGHDALYDLIKDNTADIVLTKDDETTETFSGFRYTLTILTTNDNYEVEVECTSEADRKIGDLKNEVNLQEITIAELREIVEMQIDVVDGLMSEIIPAIRGEI